MMLALLSMPALAGLAFAAMAVEPVTLKTGKGSFAFQAEIADDDAERAQGLMFRQELRPDAAMLFDFGQPRPVSMWMRNTPLSLDMIFIGPDGRVAAIARHTTPMSEEIIAMGDPVLAVLEVAAGTAERIGLKVGDRVEHPVFERVP